MNSKEFIKSLISFDGEDTSTGYVGVSNQDPSTIHIEGEYDDFTYYFYDLRDLLVEYGLLYVSEEKDGRKNFRCELYFADNEEIPLKLTFDNESLLYSPVECFDVFSKGVKKFLGWIKKNKLEGKYPVSYTALEFLKTIIEGTTVDRDYDSLEIDIHCKIPKI